MPRYGDLDALKERLLDLNADVRNLYDSLVTDAEKMLCGQEILGIHEAFLLVTDTPTADVVEVVRCNECKYCDMGENGFDAWCDCRLLRIGCDPLFYCERGERRNDG